MSKCDTCIFSRAVISENGFHWVCCLTQKRAIDCMSGVKDRYIRAIMEGE
jgi:hypothetical protein